MCLQDLRIQQSATFKVLRPTPPTLGPMLLPDLSRALWFRVYVDSSATDIHFGTGFSIEDQLPYDTRFRDSGGEQKTVSREQIGSAMIGPMYISATAPAVVLIQYLEMDAATYANANAPLSMGVI